MMMTTTLMTKKMTSITTRMVTTTTMFSDMFVFAVMQRRMIPPHARLYFASCATNRHEKHPLAAPELLKKSFAHDSRCCPPHASQVSGA